MNLDTGTEIATLRAELRKVPSDARVMAQGDRYGRLQRLLDQRHALLRMTRSRRAALFNERRWIQSEIEGYARGLALVGGDGRLQRRLDERTAAEMRVAGEVEDVEQSIDAIEAEILAFQEEMVEILRRAVSDSEDKVRRAIQARRKRLAAQWAALGEIDRLGMWSPVAVMGYRAWNCAEGLFRGVREQWGHPRYEAACSMGEGIPHTDGRCAQVAFGCGVYAAKSVDSLMKELGVVPGGQVAIGLVGLEGKVVEHKRGYRAEVATVLALALIDHKHLYLIDDADRLLALFTGSAVPSLTGSPLPMPASTAATRRTIKTFLEQQARRNETWISANRSA